MTRRRLPAVVIAALLAWLGVYLSGGSTLYRRDPAPDGRGALELVTPARWQFWQTDDFDLPIVARYVEADGTVVGPSAPFELSGEGIVSWSTDRVSIGSSATYDRRAQRWSVQRF